MIAEHNLEKDIGIEENNREKELDSIIKNKEKMIAEQKSLLEEEKRFIILVEKANEEKINMETESSEKLAPIEAKRIKLKDQLENLKQRNATEFMSKKLEQTVIETSKQLRNLENQNDETNRKIKDMEENIKISNLKLKSLLERTNVFQEDLEKTKKETNQEIENKKNEIQQKKQKYIEKDENNKKEEKDLNQKLLEDKYAIDIAKQGKQHLLETKESFNKKFDETNQKTNIILEGKKEKEDRMNELNITLKEISNKVFILEENLKVQNLKLSMAEQEKVNLQNMKRDISGENRKLLINLKKNTTARDTAKQNYENNLKEFLEGLQKKNSTIRNINERSKANQLFNQLKVYFPKRLEYHKAKRQKDTYDKNYEKYSKDLAILKENYSKISLEYDDTKIKLTDLKKRVPYLENENLEKEKKKHEIEKKYTELIEKKQKLLNIIGTTEANISYYTKSLEVVTQKELDLKLKDLSGLSVKEAEISLELLQLTEKLNQCNDLCNHLDSELANHQQTLDVQSQIIEDLKSKETELENQRKKDIEAQKANIPPAKPLKPIEINQEIIEGKIVVEPITTLKEGIGNLLKLICKNTDEKKGLSLNDIIQSDNTKSRIANEILPSILSVCKHGMDTSHWWFYTGHFWTFLQDVSYYSKETEDLIEFKQFLLDAKRDVDLLGKSFSTVQLYDAYSKSFFIHSLK